MTKSEIVLELPMKTTALILRSTFNSIGTDSVHRDKSASVPAPTEMYINAKDFGNM